MVIEEKQKNGAQLFFTSNIENYIIKGELMDKRSLGIEPAGQFSDCRGVERYAEYAGCIVNYSLI